MQVIIEQTAILRPRAIAPESQQEALLLATVAHLVTLYYNKDAYKTKQQFFSTLIMDTDLEVGEITWTHVGNEPGNESRKVT